MANKYEEKKVYYIPAFVEKIQELGKCPVKVSFRTGEERCAVDFENSQGLLFTAEEVAENVDTIARSTLDEYSEKAQRKIEALTKQLEEANETIRAFSESEDIVRTNFDAKVDENRELKSRNAELEALLKEVMATRDEAIHQNDELLAENSKLKADCNEWKDTANERLNAVQTLSEERNKVFASNAELKDWYNEANRTASETAEANDELKKKIVELRKRVGEQSAQIQDLNAEIHFLKAERDKFAKTAKDKADLANKACDERNDAQGDLVTAKAAIDYLQEENKKLNNRNKYLESEKNRKPIVHVLTNDGHVYAFTSSGKVSVKYHTELNILMIEDGEKTIAGFSRGDKPGNLSAWWMG